MKNWEGTLAAPTASIRDVIRIISENALQIALVVDANRVLLGTVTDGDIRRGLLKGVSLEDRAETVMNKNPVTCTPADSRERILKKLQKTRYHHMPIINQERVLVGMEVLEELLLPREKDNAVILMAGGLGKRMSPLTDDCPKPMLRVGGKPLLENILDNFLQYGFRKFYISVNYKAEMIESHFGDGARWGAEIKYLREDRPLGTAGALALLGERPSAPIFVMNGDLLTKVNLQQLLEFHQEQKAKLTMCVREYDLQVPFGVVNIKKSRIVAIDEKPVQKVFVNAGIYIIEPDVLDQIPKQEYFDMPSLCEKLISQKMEPAAFPLREYWIDIGRQSDFERANGEFAGQFE